MNKKYLAALLTTTILSIPFIASANPDGESLFKSNCTMCHDIDQKKMGPSVKSMSTDPNVLRTTITAGKNAMPSYDGKLSGAEIDALVKYLVASQ